MTIEELKRKLEVSYNYYNSEFENSIKNGGAGVINGMLNLGYAEAFKSILEEIYNDDIKIEIGEGV